MWEISGVLIAKFGYTREYEVCTRLVMNFIVCQTQLKVFLESLAILLTLGGYQLNSSMLSKELTGCRVHLGFLSLLRYLCNKGAEAMTTLRRMRML